MDLLIEILGAGDESSVDQEELSAQPMCQGAANRRLAGTRRAIEQNTALGAQTKLGRQCIVAQRQNNVNFEAADDVIDTLEVLEADLLHFAEVHVAGQALGTEIFDEGVGCERP